MKILFSFLKKDLWVLAETWLGSTTNLHHLLFQLCPDACHSRYSVSTADRCYRILSAAFPSVDTESFAGTGVSVLCSPRCP